jgi:hypothetical protein
MYCCWERMSVYCVGDKWSCSLCALAKTACAVPHVLLMVSWVSANLCSWMLLLCVLLVVYIQCVNYSHFQVLTFGLTYLLFCIQFKHFNKKVQLSWRSMREWIFLDLDTIAGDELSASRPGSFNPRERTAGTHWVGGWVALRAGVDDVEKRKFLSLPGFELRNLCRPARSQSLYRLRYPGSPKHL